MKTLIIMLLVPFFVVACAGTDETDPVDEPDLALRDMGVRVHEDWYAFVIGYCSSGTKIRPEDVDEMYLSQTDYTVAWVCPKHS